MSDEATIGARIRKVRRQAGQTLDQFAGAIGYSRRAVITWEQDMAMPPIDILAHLRRSYGADLEWLVMGDGSDPAVPTRKRGRSRCRSAEPHPGQMWLFKEVADSPAAEGVPPALPAVLGRVVEHVAPLA